MLLNHEVDAVTKTLLLSLYPAAVLHVGRRPLIIIEGVIKDNNYTIHC